jgi:uncharacterized membrane protein
MEGDIRMEKMIVVVFDNERKAYEGAHTLVQLDVEGSIAIHAQAVIKKNADGTVTVKQTTDEFPLGTLTGTALGSLIGLLEGPVSMAVGAGVGLLAGAAGDLYAAAWTRSSLTMLQPCSRLANAR